MGDYVYERFTPDRFQTFCSALLQKEYPGFQVYPVGQADGGRDGAATFRGKSLIIQVKFKRQLRGDDDYYKWLTDAVSKELPNIRRLAERGAELYSLVTNVPGIGRAKTGTMDRVSAFLAEKLPIPAQVLWRDDLDARLTNNYDLKWFYSEILATPDIVRQFFEEGLGADRRRRAQAIKSYLRVQYDEDALVKFKQADLQASDLLNLFVDVPGALSPDQALPPKARNEVFEMLSGLRKRASESGNGDPREAEPWRPGPHGTSLPPVPAGSLILHPSSARVFPRILVEGAPGQGKSTLAQYICQVNRMHFLNEVTSIERLKEEHRHLPLRVPFKVDLRDLAAWVEGVDPRHASDSTRHSDVRSLEAFIANEVMRLSGGQEFSVSDLHATVGNTPTLVVLDGFDEIATPALRALVVKEIDKGISRLSQTALSLQAIVTSRPSAMPGSPSFDSSTWSYVSLLSITPALALEYANRWSSARKLTAREQTELSAILAEKIQQPHLRDLARNPMQLTILLSLIHVRGQSLPDQRTALYQSYMEVFFNREAEKTRVVRDNRQLLMDLHGYLAWRMHANAERQTGDGRISTAELHDLISVWLIRGEHAEGSVDELFQGIVQRIVALVSRVEGTFEFEVQPLREYFAAHHLYHTAPYSPAGKPATGTKPEILSALIENPYWHNVLRFYAGFYSIGELPGLAVELVERLIRRSEATLVYDRAVCVNLLSDWVFHQSPKWTKYVVEAVLDPLTLRSASLNASGAPVAVKLQLHRDCGGSYVGQYAYEALAGTRSSGVADIVRRHMPTDQLYERWYSEALAADPEGLTRLLRMGRQLGILQEMTKEDAKRLIEMHQVDVNLRERLMKAGWSTESKDVRQRRRLLQSAMAGNVLFERWGGYWMALAEFLNPHFLVQGLFDTSYELFREDVWFLSDYIRKSPADLRRVLEAFRTCLSDQRSATSLEPWTNLIDELDTTGETAYMHYAIANIAAGIRSSIERGGRSHGLFDVEVPLPKRVRYARMRKGNNSWWRSQFKLASSQVQRSAWLLIAATWASDGVLLMCRHELSDILATMPSYQLETALSSVSALHQPGASSSGDLQFSRSDASEHFLFVFLFAVRGNISARRLIINLIECDDARVPPWAKSIAFRWIAHSFPTNPSAADWRRFVDLFETHSKHVDVDHIMGFNRREKYNSARLSKATAQRIIENPLNMPTPLLSSAVARLSGGNLGATTLADVAVANGWDAG